MYMMRKGKLFNTKAYVWKHAYLPTLEKPPPKPKPMTKEEKAEDKAIERQLKREDREKYEETGNWLHY